MNAIIAYLVQNELFFASLVVPTLLMAIFCARFGTKSTARGSAGWMTLWQANRYFSGLKPGLIVGDWKRWTILPLFYRGASNILTVGTPGSMKGVGMLIPNALRWPFQFIFDPGGEISAVCAKEWRRKGYNFYCINPWDMHAGEPWALPSHSFNPVDFLDPTSRTFASDADWLADMLIVRTGKESDPFFNNTAQAWLKGFLMHIKTHEVPDRQNLLVLREYIMATSQHWNMLMVNMAKNQSDPLIARQAADMTRTKDTASKQFQGVMSTLVQATAFLEDQVIRDAICASDVRIADLKGTDEAGNILRGAIVSVIVPLQYLETHAAFVRLATGCALLTMERLPLALSRVLFKFDEFAALGKMNRIVDSLANVRKYRVWINLVFQNIGQAKSLYGEGWNKIEGGCELRQYVSAWDAETSEHVAKLCGTSTISINGSPHARPLRTPEEIRQLPVDQQIVFFGNRAPALLKIRPYWDRPMLNGRYYDNPFHARTPDPSPTLPLQVLAGAVVRFTAWVLTPSPTFLVALALTIWGLS